MSNQRKEWTYYDEPTNDWVKPYVSRDDLAALYKEGRINDYTQVVNIRTARPMGPGMGLQGVMYSRLAVIDVTFSPQPDEFLASRGNRQTTVFSGPNNGGKSFFLKQIYSYIGHDGYLVSCNRFSQLDTLNSRKQEESEHVQRYRNFIVNFESSNTNNDDNEMKLDQILTGLKDAQREKLFETAGRLLGNKFAQ